MSIDVPVLGGETPAARDTETGATSVSNQTGAFQYRYAIEVPPGRRGIEPSLALTYSSQSPLFGGVAAGWSLDIPEIRLDPRQSLLAEQEPNYVPIFESTLASGHRLVQVAEPAASDVIATFRAQYDPTYARYERLIGNKWRVRTRDGRTHYFGEFDHQSSTSDSLRFRLTRTVDEFGNTVHYWWEAIYDGDTLVDHVISRIEYATNEAAGLGPHAVVLFSYAPPQSCVPGSNFPIGAKLEQRGAAVRYRGSRQLRFVARTVRSGTDFRSVRTTILNYSSDAARCDQKHGPLRLLTSIAEHAISPSGETTMKPSIAFTYGPLERDLTQMRSFLYGFRNPVNFGIQAGKRFPSNVTTEQAWPTLDATLLDFDGDGRLDQVSEDGLGSDGGCQLVWERNTGNGFQITGDEAWVDLPSFRPTGRATDFRWLAS